MSTDGAPKSGGRALGGMLSQTQRRQAKATAGGAANPTWGDIGRGIGRHWARALMGAGVPDHPSNWDNY